MTIAPALRWVLDVIGDRALRDIWDDDEMLEQKDVPRERDSDSSLQPQYEDSVLPDREWEHEVDS